MKKALVFAGIIILFVISVLCLKNAVKNDEQDSLSANDTHVSINDRINNVGKLDVLSAGVVLTNAHSVGSSGKSSTFSSPDGKEYDVSDSTYSALYIMKGSIVFSVDLKDAAIKFNGDGTEASITVPSPASELVIDNAETEKIAEKAKKIFNGSTNDGYQAYLNSYAQIITKSEEAVENYDSLCESAESAAKKQIAKLAESLCGKDVKINVIFSDE